MSCFKSFALLTVILVLHQNSVLGGLFGFGKSDQKDADSTTAATTPSSADDTTKSGGAGRNFSLSMLAAPLNIFSHNGTNKTDHWLLKIPKPSTLFHGKKDGNKTNEEGKAEKKDEPKKAAPSRLRAKLISSSNLDELPPAAIDQSPKEASKANLPNLTRSSTWQLPDFNLTNLSNLSPNFTISNWDLFKWNGLQNNTNLLNFNTSREWFNSSADWFSARDWFVGLKARYYGSLLNSSASGVQSAGTKPNETTSSTTLPPSITTTVPAINSTTNTTDEANMSLFRKNLLNVYDSLTFCEHPCNGKRVKKNVNAFATINGCGPSYFSERQLSMIPYGELFRDCCNFHDSRYGECGFKKQEADYSFLDCMLNLVNRTSIEDKNTWPKIRKSFGYALFGMVDLFGCKAWAISQMEVCSCG